MFARMEAGKLVGVPRVTGCIDRNACHPGRPGFLKKLLRKPLSVGVM
jgi:hypothetical protein